jgi:TatD DNase family protein
LSDLPAVLIDTHCHLGDPAFDADRAEVVMRMQSAGIRRAVVIESDLTRLSATSAWVASEPDLWLATGCHPHDAAAWPACRDQVLAAWALPSVVAAGEMGLDYHYDHAPRDLQRRVFSEQLALAVGQQLPVIVHAREADSDVAAIAREQPGHPIVLHSFSSGAALREAGLVAGWYFSFSGMITFKSWSDIETVRAVSPDRLLLETDAPYLAPVPHRGHRNEPGYLVATATRLAEIRGTTFAEIAATTSANAERLFAARQPT